MARELLCNVDSANIIGYVDAVNNLSGNNPAMVKSPSHPATKKRYHHGDVRNACVKAALGLAKSAGLENVTLRNVADLVGVSRTAPYRHFACKRDLLAASAALGFRELENELRAASEAAGSDSTKRLFAGCRAYAKFGADNPSLYRLMFSSDFSEDEYPELSDAGTAAFAYLVEELENAQAEGRVKAGNAQEQGVAIWSAIHGVVNLYIDSKPSKVLDTSALQDNVRLVVTIIFSGVGA